MNGAVSLDVLDDSALSLEEQAWSAQIVSSSGLAAMVLLIWECLITFGDELRCIWSKPRSSWTKWFFLVSRYLALCCLVLMSVEYGMPGIKTSSECTGWNVWQGIALQLQLATVDVLLMMRVYALYNRSLLIARLLTLCFICAHSVMAWSLALALPAERTTDHCFLIASSPNIRWFGLASIVLQTLLFVLTAVKFFGAARAGWGRTALIALIMRDGTWAFALVFAGVLTNSFCFIALHNGLNSVAFPWLFTVSSLAACRLVLNTHATVEDPGPLEAYSSRGRRVRGRATAASTTLTGTHMQFTTRIASDHDQSVDSHDIEILSSSYAPSNALSNVRQSGDTSANTLIMEILPPPPILARVNSGVQWVE